MSDAEADRNNLKGAWWIGVSVLGASVMTLAARLSYEEIDSRMLVMLRAIGGIALTYMALGVAPRLVGPIRFSKPWLHIIRGAMVGASTSPAPSRRASAAGAVERSLTVSGRPGSMGDAPLRLGFSNLLSFRHAAEGSIWPNGKALILLPDPASGRMTA